MKLSAASRRKRRALETAARELRAAQGSDRDEILAARRALRQAEKFYDRAVARAQRDLNIARAPSRSPPTVTRLILYDDRLSTPTGPSRWSARCELRSPPGRGTRPAWISSSRGPIGGSWSRPET